MQYFCYQAVPAPWGFGNWLDFWLVLVLSVINGVLMLFAGYKFLQVLQLSGYKVKGCLVWLKDTKFKYWGRLAILSFLSCSALFVTNVLLEEFFIAKILTYVGLLFYFVFCLVFIRNMYDAPKKTPLKYTKRMTRLCVCLVVLVVLVTGAFLTLSFLNFPHFRYGIVGVVPAILPLLILLAHYIMVPIENLNSLRYIKLAKKKLESHKKMIVIGITGSYGKTSVKNILSVMLSEKYSVCATPFSYNTPLGLSKTILNNLKNDDEVLIAEMGAKYVGDINYLCEMVKPNIGLITGIGNQHLATFGSQENLINTKFELVEGIKTGGEIYFNVDGQMAGEMYDRTKIKKYGTTINSNSGDYFVSDIKLTERGSEFVLHLKDEKITCETALLGKHNISNILVCSALCYNMGVDSKSIKLAISKLVPSAHRLAIIPSQNSLVVIDDAYNGSVEGTKAALDTIKEFSTKKIIITPGLVELGKEQFNSNFEMGRQIADVCDYVIINGVVNFEAIYAGLEFAGFDTSKILRAGSLKQSIEVLNSVAKAGDVVLFENDLPDNYT